MENLRRRRIKPVIGNKNSIEERLKGVETKRKDTWDLYVGNVDVDVTKSQIVDYLKKQEISDRKCILLTSKVQGTKSARVTISLEDKDRALRPELWPEFVRVRSWVIKPRWALEKGGSNLVGDGRIEK